MNLRKQEIYLSKRSTLITYFLSFGQGADIDVKKQIRRRRNRFRIRPNCGLSRQIPSIELSDA